MKIRFKQKSDINQMGIKNVLKDWEEIILEMQSFNNKNPRNFIIQNMKRLQRITSCANKYIILIMSYLICLVQIYSHSTSFSNKGIHYFNNVFFLIQFQLKI